MVFKCTGVKGPFSYRDKSSGETTQAVIFYGIRYPNSRDGDMVGYVADSIFIGERNLGLIPKGKFEPNSAYNFEYASDGKYSYLDNITAVDKF